MQRITRRIVPAFVVATLASLGLVACTSTGAPASPASCAFVYGNGEDGHNARLHKVVYPGQTVHVDDGGDDPSEKKSYVPCNSRNYITNNGTVKDANGNVVGDRHVLTTAYTSTGVPIQIGTTVNWTLNESKDAMDNFYTFCFKYTCQSSDDKAGTVNSSTKGWNSMLGENFGPAVDADAAKAAFTVDDSIWQKHDPSQYASLGNEMTKNFADIIRAKTGFPQDLFCGSGNSGWTNPDDPGKGKFTCTPVRITVDYVQRGAVSATDNTAGAIAINRQRLTNAVALYGDNAKYWLALQDTIKSCPSGSTCVFNIGADGTPITVPGTK